MEQSSERAGERTWLRPHSAKRRTRDGHANQATDLGDPAGGYRGAQMASGGQKNPCRLPVEIPSGFGETRQELRGPCLAIITLSGWCMLHIGHKRVQALLQESEEREKQATASGTQDPIG